MKRTLWILAFLVLMVSACQTQVEPTETVVPSETVTRSATSAPPTATVEPSATSTGTMTPWPTKTPTITPIYLSSKGEEEYGEIVPETEPITIDNIDQLELLAEWGNGALYDVGLTPDDEQIVAATAPGIYWYDAVTMEELRFVPYTMYVSNEVLKLSPSTEYFAYMDYESDDIYILKTEDCSLYQKIERPSPPKNFWFTPDETELFVQYEDSFTFVWNLEENTWTDEQYLEFNAISFGESGDHFVAIKAKTHQWVEYNGDIEPKLLEELGWGGWTFDVSDDGRYLVDVFPWRFRVWDLELEQMVLDHCLEPDKCIYPESNTPLKNTSPVTVSGGMAQDTYDIAISHNNQFVIFSMVEDYGKTRLIYRYDFLNDRLISKERVPQRGNILIPQSGDLYYLWNEDIQVRRIHQDGVLARADERFASAFPRGLVYSPGSNLLGIAGRDNIFRLYDASTGAVDFQKVSFSGSSEIAFVQYDSKVFLSEWDDQKPVILDYESGEIITIPAFGFGWHEDYAAVSADGSYVHWSRPDKVEYFYHIGDEEVQSSETTVRFHPFEAEMTMATIDGATNIYAYRDLETTQVGMIELENYGYWISNWGYLSSGNGYFCRFEDGLEIIRGDERIIIEVESRYDDSHSSEAYYPDFTIDDRLAFVYHAGVVLVYDLDTGLRIAEVHSSGTAFDLSPDNKYLAVAGYDGIIRIWGVPVE